MSGRCTETWPLCDYAGRGAYRINTHCQYWSPTGKFGHPIGASLFIDINDALPPDTFRTRRIESETRLLTKVWPDGRNPAVRDGDHFVVRGYERPVSVSRVESLLLANIAILTGAKRILEIGAGFGYSGMWLAYAVQVVDPQNGLVYTVDDDSEGGLGQLANEVALDLLRSIGLQRYLTRIRGDSPACLTAIPSVEKFDLVFIDGNHHGDQPTKDLVGALQAATPRAIVLLHDDQAGYTVAQAVATGVSLGLHALRLQTSCNMTVLARTEDGLGLVQTALDIANRGHLLGVSNAW